MTADATASFNVGDEEGLVNVTGRIAYRAKEIVIIR